MFAMKTHTLIYPMSSQMKRKYKHDINKVRNNDLYMKS